MLIKIDIITRLNNFSLKWIELVVDGIVLILAFQKSISYLIDIRRSALRKFSFLNIQK